MGIQVILQIDDDPEDCELFQEALKAVSGADYHAIHDAFKALTVLKSGSLVPDIIFLDLNMPRMDGREFLEAIKGVKALKAIPVILFFDIWCAGDDAPDKRIRSKRLYNKAHRLQCL